MDMYLNVEKINKGFGEGDSRVEVLKEVSFGVGKGEICVMLGPSGSGKSTLLNIIGGIETADSGAIAVGADRLESMSERALSMYRRKHLGYIFQSYNGIPIFDACISKEDIYEEKTKFTIYELSIITKSISSFQ